MGTSAPLVTFAPGRVSTPHFHDVPQYQIMLGGRGKLGCQQYVLEREGCVLACSLLTFVLYFTNNRSMESTSAIQALAALAQESRLAVFRLLVQAGPTGVSAGEIAAELKLAPATLSFHLKELSHANLVLARQQGRFVFYSANFEQMGALVAFLTENCCAHDGVACVPQSHCRLAETGRSVKSKRKGVKA